jgi:ligand-binding sensor domain-containing protein
MSLRSFLVCIVLFCVSEIMAQKPGDKVLSLFVDEFNQVWFGTDKGLLRKCGDVFKAYYALPGSPGQVNDIKHPKTVDSELWIGTTTGIIRLIYSSSDIRSSTFFDTTATTSASKNIRALEFDDRNVCYFTTSRGIGIFANSAWRFYTKFFDIIRDEFTSIGAKGDTMYIGTLGEGVARIVKRADGYTGASSYITPWSAIHGDSINAILIDSKGNQWYGTNKGLSRHSSTEAKEGWDISLIDELPDRHVTCLAEDTRGNIWIGTRGGLVELDSDLTRINTWTSEKGLPSDVINCIFVCKDQSVWIGTDLGASYFNRSVFFNIRTSDYGNNFIQL